MKVRASKDVGVGGREERMGVSADEEVYVAPDQGLQAGWMNGNHFKKEKNMGL